ncbi:MAG TPA: hypothetical protein VF432_31620 [Thermoanaerobaculia bacterium]
MRTVIALATALLVACASSSSDTPKYTTRVESVGGDTWSVHLDSVTTMSEEAVKRALLTEAARATIDRGKIYLVVHDLAYEGSTVNVDENTGPDVAPPQTPTSSEPAVRSEVSFSRQRSGTIRFTVFRDLPAGNRVFDASQLLDRLGRGEMPM